MFWKVVVGGPAHAGYMAGLAVLAVFAVVAMLRGLIVPHLGLEFGDIVVGKDLGHQQVAPSHGLSIPLRDTPVLPLDQGLPLLLDDSHCVLEIRVFCVDEAQLYLDQVDNHILGPC
jgi:hypothetical protein